MAKHTVVVLLDNEEYYKEMERIFSDLDKFEIVGYSGDGREGIEIVKRTRPEILILDLILKTCDGFAVMDKLASEGIDVKTVVISSFSKEEIISKAIARGALYYMVKPEYQIHVREEMYLDMSVWNLKGNRMAWHKAIFYIFSLIIALINSRQHKQSPFALYNNISKFKKRAVAK